MFGGYISSVTFVYQKSDNLFPKLQKVLRTTYNAEIMIYL